MAAFVSAWCMALLKICRLRQKREKLLLPLWRLTFTNI